MSYCRWGTDSDVYVYGTQFYDKDRGRIIDVILCCDCKLSSAADDYYETPGDMLAHLLEHRKLGHKVPESALERLREEESEPPHAA